MKKIVLIIGITISIYSQSRAQSYSMQYLMLNRYIEALNNNGEYLSNVKDYSEIKGTPYLNPEFLDGRIVTKDDKIYAGKLRFNIYADEMEFMNADKIYSFAKNNNITEFYVDNQLIIYQKYLDGKQLKTGYLLVLVKGKYSLLVKKRIDFEKQDPPQPYTTQKPDRFIPRDDVFFLWNLNSPIQKIVSIKKMINSFPELEKILSTYNENKVNFRDQDDLKKLVDYINLKVANP
jgi:hypothetical protein